MVLCVSFVWGSWSTVNEGLLLLLLFVLMGRWCCMLLEHCLFHFVIWFWNFVGLLVYVYGRYNRLGCLFCGYDIFVCMKTCVDGYRFCIL